MVRLLDAVLVVNIRQPYATLSEERRSRLVADIGLHLEMSLCRQQPQRPEEVVFFGHVLFYLDAMAQLF